MEQNTLKTTLKAPKANKVINGVIGACASAKEVAEAITAFWGNGDLGSDEKFILKKLSQLAQQDEPSESEITGFTGMTTALMGNTLKSAQAQMFMGSSLMLMQFLVPVGQALNTSWFGLNNERAWKFVFVSGDVFRIRSVVKAWNAATTDDDRDVAASKLRTLLKPVQGADNSIKGEVVALLKAVVGDLLDQRVVNIFKMMKISSQQPSPATITQAQADERLAPVKQAGASLINSLDYSAAAALSEAKNLAANWLDPNHPHSMDWLNIKTMFGEHASQVKDALVSGRYGYGSPSEKNGCQNYSNEADNGARSWLKEFMVGPIEKVSPVLDELRQKILDASKVSEEDAVAWVMGIKISNKLIAQYDSQAGREGALIEDLKDVYRLAGGQINTLSSIGMTNRRSYAQKSTRSIKLNPRGGKRVLWHEVGHHFEFTNPDYLKQALSYLTERAGGGAGTIKPLNQFYENTYSNKEIAIADHLSSPYVGKVYCPNKSVNIHSAYATEIFSSGFEYLANPRGGAVSLMNDDQLVQFVSGILKGVHGL